MRDHKTAAAQVHRTVGTEETILFVMWRDRSLFLCESIRAVTIHQTHDSVRITIFDPRFGSYHDFFVEGGRKKKKDF